MKRSKNNANGKLLTLNYLKVISYRYIKCGYKVSKWILFSEYLIERFNFKIYLYRARKTKSKYLTLCKDQKTFLVRFSDHKPNFRREIQKDCDFFVGHSNLNTTTTRDAYSATLEHFGLKHEDRKRKTRTI